MYMKFRFLIDATFSIVALVVNMGTEPAETTSLFEALSLRWVVI
jgi:hypothetical protein